jgi:type VI secretion system protein ImpL
MTKRKLIISLLLFLLYEVLVVLGCRFLVSEDNFLLAVVFLSALGLTIFVVYILVSRLTRQVGGGGAAASAPAGGNGQAAPPPPVSASGPDPEIDAVVGLISEANTRLAQSPTLASRRIRTSVTNLPMYLLVGPEGGGKTTTFLGAGLEPELLAGQVYRDAVVLPTKLCNFWYAGEAAFVETSGSFFSQEPARWMRLLKHLRGKKAGSFLSNLLPGGKTQSNLRGAILFVDISPFVGIPDPGRIGGLGRRIQERLRLIGESFGVHFPVYVIFSKADGIPYFADYFARLADNEDQQILGCTLPILTAAQRPAGEVFAESESARLTETFNELYYSLAEKRTTFLAREPVAARKVPTYEFPREMKRLRDTLMQFLVDVFRPNPLQPSPILRGYYFTGTRQVAASAGSAGGIGAVQRGPATGEATSLFNLQDYQKKMGTPAPEAQGEPTVTRWSFVSELFHRVVLADRLQSVAGFRHRKKDLYRRIAYGCVTFVGLVLCFCFLRSWWGNRSLLADVQAAAEAPYRYQAAPGAVPTLDDLRAMEGLRQQLEILETYDRDSRPLRLRWFLYSGNRVLPDAYHLYFQRFRAMFFNDFYGRVAAGLGALPATSDGSVSYDTAYSQVRAYRMITSCKCKPDKTFLSPLFYNSWSNGRTVDTEQQALIQKQLDFYADELSYKNPYDLDEKKDLVDRGRSYLATTQGVDQLYHGLIEEVNRSVPPARIADFYPDFKKVLTGPGEVPGAFTMAGWKAVEKAIREGAKGPRGDACVLGATAAVAQFIPGGGSSGADLEALYWRDYIQRWEDFARQTKVAPFGSAADAAAKLSILSDTRSPLLAAVFLISKNSAFPAPPKAAAGAAGPGAMGKADGMAKAAQSGGLFSSLTSKFSSAERKGKALSRMKSAAGSEAPQAAAVTSADVARVFQPAQVVALPTVTDRLVDAPNQSYVSALQSMQQAMDNLKDDRASNPNLTLHEAAKNASQSGQKTVSDLAGKFNINGTDGMDIVLKDFLVSPFNLAMRFVITDAGKVGRDKAGAAGKSFCAALAKVQKKFPFDPQSAQDASLDEFSSIFGPQNSAYATLQQALGKSIVKQGRFWVNAPDADPKLSGDFLSFLNRIAAISEGFFPADANGQARMKYTLKIEPAPKVQGFTLTIDGETAATTGNTAQAKTFTWPGSGQQMARLRVNVGASVPFGDYNGLWAAFRLLANADPHPAGSRVAVLSKVRGQGASQAAQVTDGDGNPIVVKIDISDAPNGIDIFDPRFFALRCPSRVTE